jgi:hypothetical protein
VGPDCWSVEEGTIVGRTSGLKRNEFLRSEMELRDFRLAFEVRLVGDAGNSGVQFRSRELEDGEMVGYQADIGPGWWGRLYEESGRGILAEKTAEEHVVKDGWNRYEIEARGHHVRLLDQRARVRRPGGSRRGALRHRRAASPRRRTDRGAVPEPRVGGPDPGRGRALIRGSRL